MQAITKPSVLTGTVTAPASKSAMQRACAAALIKKGRTKLLNPGTSADDLAALGIIQQMGAAVIHENDAVIIQSDGIRDSIGEINCGESGLSARLFTSLVAVSKNEVIVNGSGSLLARPFAFFDEAMQQLGVQCTSNHGHLPIRIQGPLQPADITIDGSLSSQFLTGLLFAYSAAGASDVTIKVNNLNSKPYVELTLKVLKDFDLIVPSTAHYNEFHFQKTSANSEQRTVITDLFEYKVEGDWSGASFFLVAGAIAGKDLVIKGLDLASVQADRKIMEVLEHAGADMEVAGDEIILNKSRLKGFRFNATHCPDLFPPLVALALHCQGESVIEGVHRLTYKESDRALTLQKEFSKLGAEVIYENDRMTIKPPSSVNSVVAHSHYDHRIAMALAVASMGGTESLVIEAAESVNKSYPDFWQHLQNIGGGVSLSNQS
jgi:3-phosphoshikimate 1-carboxyvinyltransferase